MVMHPLYFFIVDDSSTEIDSISALLDGSIIKTKNPLATANIWINGFRLPADQSTNLMHGDYLGIGSISSNS